MKYEVIARRYRPRRFEEVVGQEAVALTLRGAIVQDRLAHAYLFCGPRGCGKTSLARIFAKALNCPRAADRTRPREEWAQPCNECSVCEAIHNGRDIDVIEMDGASHRGIEDIRQIVEGVNRPATRGLYKVYIIDEVHMLTREAFNALLKTLEEPPGHVKFIFATTEPHKIPDTVLSRVQRFDIQPIGLEDIARRLRQICEAESREAPDELLLRIARYSKGGLRDSQTLLDQLMTFCEGPLTLDALDALTGRMAEAAVATLVEEILSGDAAGVLATVRECFGRGADPSILLEQVIESLHDLMADLVRSNDANDAGKLDRVVGSLQILLETAARLRSSAYPDVAVEVAFLKLARLPDPRGFQRALEQLAEIESGAAAATGDRPRHAPSGFGGPSAAGPPRSTAEPVPPRPGPPRSREPDRGAPPRASGGGFAPELRGGDDSDPQPAPAVDAAAAGGSGSIGAIETGPEGSTAVSSATSADTPVDPRRLLALWDQIHIELQDRHPNIAPLVAGGAPTPHADGTLIVRLGKRFSWTQMRSGPKLAIYEELVRDVTGAPWKIRIEYDASLEGRASAPASNPYAASPESAGSAPQEAGSRPSSNGSPSARAQPTGGTSIGRPAGKLEGEIVTKAMKLFNARPV